MGSGLSAPGLFTGSIASGPNMTSGRSRLLELPRELRNEIYSYLTHEIEFEWLWRRRTHHLREYLPWIQPNSAESHDYDTVKIKVRNAPVPAVLLTHSQLHDEYREAPGPCFKNLDIVLDKSCSRQGTQPDETEDKKMKLLEQIMARVQHVTVFNSWYCDHGFRDVTCFVEAIASMAPNLVTVKLALAEKSDALEDSKLWQDINPFPASSRVNFLPTPPHILVNNFTLVQRGEGYSFEYGWETELGPLGQVYIYHKVKKVGVYVYTRSEAGKVEKRFWEPREVIEHWPLREYPQGTLDRASKERAEKMARFPFEMREWKERRGDEVKNW